MLFMCVVPDKFYFVWQIELQLYHFGKLGIAAAEIHILVGVDKKYGPSIWITDLVRRHEDKACFFIYKKEVDGFAYEPAIRPHILRQHFTRFPELSREAIFYHDSDIIFRELPDFRALCAGDEWWMSDCRSYLDSRFLRGKGDGVFETMCELVGIDAFLVEANDGWAGGAQALLKGVDADFWAAVETDCLRLYDYLAGVEGIQAWCADMWALLWNGWKLGKTIRLSPELDFSWASDPIEAYGRSKIFHNAGTVAVDDLTVGTPFEKGKFQMYSPYYFRHEQYSRQYCSWEYVQLIRKFEEERPKEDLTDVTFLIPVFIDSPDRLINLEITTRYIYKHFTTSVIVVEAGPRQKVDVSRLAPNTEYHYIADRRPLFHRTHYNNRLIQWSRTKYIALYDVDVVFPPAQVLASVEALREGAVISYPYSGVFCATAAWVTDIFRMTLDTAHLLKLEDKHSIGSRRSVGGCVFLDRATFIAYGGENEHLTSWGPDDLERAARFKILGHGLHRAPGHLYHLHHERGVNSGYQPDTYRPLMAEYLGICSRTREELLDYIRTWGFFDN